jgi:hypothetical protein
MNVDGSKARNMPESGDQQECGFGGGLPDNVKVNSINMS